jgi:GT2 family glycosyltransferase
MDALRWRDEQRRLRATLTERRGGERPSPTGASTPFVSVIVVCWNAADVLERCLEHLLAQVYVDREIVVVDDGSDDGTFEIAERISSEQQLTLVRSPRNRGCPAARNLGLRHAGGEIVAFIDADGFADPSWLTNVVDAFGEDETIGGVASTVFYDDNPLVVNGAGGTVNRQGWAADLAMNESYEHAELAAEALYPMGCGMALRRSAIGRVGPFDAAMLNYYDDVDYGVRVWRAGFRIAVARHAWIDHAVVAGDSPHKRLLCERHRMRVVLKYAPVRLLGRWLAYEARGLRSAHHADRARKLRAIAWNVRHLPGTLASRLRSRRAAAVPERLVDPSWGDGFPSGVPLRLRPRPERAGTEIDMADADADVLLPYGWYPAETSQGRSVRWAGPCAAALVSLQEPARRLSLDYTHVPVDCGEVEVRLRPLGATDPLASSWSTRLRWQYLARSVENHPLVLPAGDYEVLLDAERGWSDPPRETRTLALALARLTLARSFELAEGGLEIGSPAAEQHLVSGWYEQERGAERAYRWAGGQAKLAVRIAAPARTMGLAYRLPPVANGGLTVTVGPLHEAEGDRFSTTLPWRDGEWHEVSLAVELQAGEYLVSFGVERPWSNPEGRDPSLWPENRSLGFAISSLDFA